MAQIIDGKALAAKVKAEVAAQVQALQARGALHVLVWLKGRAEPGQVREVRFL